LAIPSSPLVYWVSDYFLDLLANATKLGSYAKVLRGLDTGDVDRFVRYWWEVGNRSRWTRYVRGGGYVKWIGLQFLVVDWEGNGRRLKATGSAIVPSEHTYNDAGLTYSDFADSLGVRKLAVDEIPSDASPVILTNNDYDTLLGILNTRIPTYLLRMISPGSFHLRTGYVASIPLPLELPTDIRKVVRAAVSCKRFLVRRKLQVDRMGVRGAVHQGTRNTI